MRLRYAGLYVCREGGGEVSIFDDEQWGSDAPVLRSELEDVAALIRDVLDDPPVADVKSAHLDRLADWLTDHWSMAKAHDARAEVGR